MCLTKIDAQILNFLTMLHYIIHLIYIIIQLYWGFYIIIQPHTLHWDFSVTDYIKYFAHVTYLA